MLRLILFFLLITETLQAIQLHGHRGARALRPENTWPAFEYALNLPVDVLELDLNVTKDFVLMINHDPYINKELCLDQNGKELTENISFKTLTSLEAKKYDCGAKKNKNFPKQVTIPNTHLISFEDFLNLIEKSKISAAKNVHFNVEMKYDSNFFPKDYSKKRYAEDLLSLVNKFKMNERTIVQSFDYECLDEIRKLDSKIRTSALSKNFFEDLVKTAKTHQVQISSPKYAVLSQRDVKRLKEEKIQIVPWTLNEESEWKKVIEWQLDGVITDDPEAFLKFKEQSIKK